MFLLQSRHRRRVIGQSDRAIPEWSAGLGEVPGQGRQTGCVKREPWTAPSFTSFFYFLLQVNVKRPLRDESHFEVVESGRYVILLLGQALSVVWDHHLSISVVLKHTYQVSWPSGCILPVVHVD